MLYIIHLTVLLIWMAAIIFKRKLSWHSIVAAYVISVFIVDFLEVLLNLMLNFYKFPTHLLNNPIYDNQLGIIFGDTLILPFTYIILVHYNCKYHPWLAVIPFTLGQVTLELIYLKLGYFQYHNWNIVYSAAVYLAAFRLGAFLAPRISSYSPPVPYPIRLHCFTYTTIMWVGALFGLPVLKYYQFKTGLFNNIMADDRFVDLYSGIALGILCAIIVPRLLGGLRLLSLAIIACIGISFAFYFYYKGWLIYHNWNHFFTILRYLVPFILIMLYDRWESSYHKYYSRN